MSKGLNRLLFYLEANILRLFVSEFVVKLIVLLLQIFASLLKTLNLPLKGGRIRFLIVGLKGKRDSSNLNFL